MLFKFYKVIISNSSSGNCVSWKSFKRWPFTLKSVPSSFWSVMAPWDNVLITLQGPSHLLHSFPCPNNFTLELKSNTLPPGLNSFFFNLLSCHFFVLALRVLHYDMPFLSIPLAQRVAFFSSSQLLQSPYFISLWHNVLWIPTRQVGDMYSCRQVDMVTFQEMFCKLYYKPIVLCVTYLSMLFPSHW